MADLYTLQDPTKQYPRSKFRHQQQRIPGSDKKMQPLADHVEESYRGSGRLPNRKALVTGGDSGIGRAAAIAFAREGADVAINYLPSEEADAKEVIALIEAEGRKAIALPSDPLGQKKNSGEDGSQLHAEDACSHDDSRTVFLYRITTLHQFRRFLRGLQERGT